MIEDFLVADVAVDVEAVAVVEDFQDDNLVVLVVVEDGGRVEAEIAVNDDY